MRALLVTAHPLSDSLNAHFADQAQAAAIAAGHQIERLDLYAADFDPRLSAEERRSYYGATPFSPDQALARQIEQLEGAELLILIFPTWWFSFPAILKGWFDRLWRPGIAFDHAADMGRITPRLNKLRHVVAITTLGSPRWIDLLVLRQPVKRVLRWSILKPCAPQARLHWLSLYSAETASQRDADTFAARIRRTITDKAR